ncbi:MAG: DUF655 domain-containing protein [Candidatus Micrarchaeia archaeon]|jgi:putative nucleotide binding protein
MFKKEDYAIVLDFLPQGRATEARREPVAQVIGEQYFTLLEVSVKPDAKLAPGDRVYIGRDARDQVDHIRGRINSDGLTNGAQRELGPTIRKIILTREKEFVDFLNRAGAINIRAHVLELLPGVGKKHLQDLVAERSKKPFESFADVQTRVPHMIKAEELFVQRITEELKGGSKYYLFVKIPQGEREDRY